jgi:ABC-type sugar transport system substrate-binding protein
MKKFVLASLSVGAALMVAATAQTAEKNVAFVYWNTTTNAFQEMALGVKQAVKESQRVNLVSTAPNSTNPSQVVSMFQSATQTSKDGIILQALVADIFARPVKDATAAGIPVIAIDAPPPANAGVDLFVSNDNFEVGRAVAREIIKSIPADAKGEIVLGTTGPGVPPLEHRLIGMQEIIKKERPNVTIVGPLNTAGATGTGSVSENYEVWNGIIKAHPDALAFMAPSNTDAATLATYQRQTGKKLLVGGCDLEPLALQGVKDGYIRALGSPEHWLKGYIAMKLLINNAQKGKAIPKGFWDSGALLITRANINAMIVRQGSEATRAAYFKPIAAKQLANPPVK